MGVAQTDYHVTLADINQFPAIAVGDVVKLVNHSVSPSLSSVEFTVAEKVTVDAATKRLRLISPQVYNAATVCGYVVSVGPAAYKDTSKFPDGPWCKEKDWVIFGRYAGARLQIEGGEIRLLNDDEILATISNPEDILHIY